MSCGVCVFVTDEELAVLIAEGYQHLSGPFDTEGDCTSSCCSSGSAVPCDDCGCAETPAPSWEFQISPTIGDGDCDCSAVGGIQTLAFDENCVFSTFGELSFCLPIPECLNGTNESEWRLVLGCDEQILTFEGNDTCFDPVFGPIHHVYVEYIHTGAWDCTGTMDFELQPGASDNCVWPASIAVMRTV